MSRLSTRLSLGTNRFIMPRPSPIGLYNDNGEMLDEFISGGVDLFLHIEEWIGNTKDEKVYSR